MLVQLSISNFAIIKHLDITFRPGLNILSGETGTGKSIIINAMNLILGGRASSDLIRSGCEEARVEALFTLPENSRLKEVLSASGFSFDVDLLIKRTIFREGRNKITINDSLATLQTLSRIGDTLISISGQHEHQLLLNPDNHLYLLDEYGGLQEERKELSRVFNRFRSLKEEIQRVNSDIRETGEKQELARFQIQEIHAAAINLGEDRTLLEERTRLRHAEDLLKIVAESYEAIYENQDSTLSSLSRCIREIEKGVQIDSQLVPVRENLAEIKMKLEDAAFALRDFRKTVQLDPYRLEEVEERIQALNALKRKYAPTLEGILAFRDKLVSMVDTLNERKNRLEELEKELEEVRKELTTRAHALSGKRKDSAAQFEKAVERELQSLHMAETRFKVNFRPLKQKQDEIETDGALGIGGDGWDEVEFLISPNVGEDLKPLSKIASGGELSRLTLAMKTFLAKTSSVESVIFDEVDSGISGATAEVIGEKLLSLSRYHQTLCITHLPQIASKGQAHFQVKKDVVTGRTQTTISELNAKERVQEIARLLGGKKITPRALAHAKEMLARRTMGAQEA